MGEEGIRGWGVGVEDQCRGRRHGGGTGGSVRREGVGLVWRQEIKVDCASFEGVESVSHRQLLVRLRSEVVSELVSGWEDGLVSEG